MVPIYVDKAGTALKANAIVNFHSPSMFVNFLRELRPYLMNHGYSLVGLPGYTLELLNSQEKIFLGLEKSLAASNLFYLTYFLHVIYFMNNWEPKLQILHAAVHRILQLLSSSSDRGFEVCQNRCNFNSFFRVTYFSASI